MSASIRLLIADDHPVVRRGLAAMTSYETDMTVVAEASNGREVVELWMQHRPDVTLLDLRMPEMDGVEAILRVRERFTRARYVLLTTYDEDEAIYQGISAGASGYLLKDAPSEELLESIRAVHAGQKRIPQSIASKLADRVGRTELSSREKEILALLVEGRSNLEIARALFIAETTVKYHVTHLLAKLGVSDRTQAVSVALRRGLVRLN